MTASGVDVLAPPSLGSISDGVHRSTLRVYVEDTDAGGIVYHAKYLHFFERSRTQLLASLGYGLSTLMQRGSADYRAFVVRRADVRYIAPARLDDVLVTETRIARLGRASIDFDQRIRRGSEEIAAGVIYVGCIDASGRPRPLPAGMGPSLGEILPSTFNR